MDPLVKNENPISTGEANLTGRILSFRRMIMAVRRRLPLVSNPEIAHVSIWYNRTASLFTCLCRREFVPWKPSIEKHRARSTDCVTKPKQTPPYRDCRTRIANPINSNDAAPALIRLGRGAATKYVSIGSTAPFRDALLIPQQTRGNTFQGFVCLID